mgnify:CR=1 FL=1
MKTQTTEIKILKAFVGKRNRAQSKAYKRARKAYNKAFRQDKNYKNQGE